MPKEEEHDPFMDSGQVKPIINTKTRARRRLCCCFVFLLLLAGGFSLIFAFPVPSESSTQAASEDDQLPSGEEEITFGETEIVKEVDDPDGENIHVIIAREEARDEEEQGREEHLVENSIAPRSAPGLEYNEIDPTQKYLLYSAAGGFSNQQEELENLLIAARVMKRTLFVPMVGRHSSTYHAYELLGLRDLFSADRIFDFNIMGSYVRVIPLNQTVTSFARSFAMKHGANKISTVFHPPGKEWDREMWAKNMVTSNSWVVFLHGNGIWGRWYSRDKIHDVQHYVTFSPFLRQASIKIIRAVIGEPYSFNAVHGRLGDLKNRWGRTTSEYFVRQGRRHGWSLKTKVYLASDEPHDPFFGPLRSTFPVIDWTAFKDIKEIRDYENLFPEKSGMRQDMFGVLDKLICAQAKSFYGSEFSTFTMEIKIMRFLIKDVFPEAYALKEHKPK